MTTVFIATSNKGKQAEIIKYAKLYGKGIKLLFPDGTNKLDIDESGATFEENALLKASAYQRRMNDDTIIFVGDDSGIQISALNNEPGIRTRRWAGYEMTDAEIIDYCLERMQNLTGDKRVAIFRTVLAALVRDHEPKYFNGLMKGRVMTKPLDGPITRGLPFNSLFWVDELGCSLRDVHSQTPGDKKGFVTHREMAFKNFFKSLV
jgi:XTP/dITP diphosphohydrolase